MYGFACVRNGERFEIRAGIPRYRSSPRFESNDIRLSRKLDSRGTALIPFSCVESLSGVYLNVSLRGMTKTAFIVIRYTSKGYLGNLSNNRSTESHLLWNVAEVRWSILSRRDVAPYVAG